jgi:hypothetical protein
MHSILEHANPYLFAKCFFLPYRDFPLAHVEIFARSRLVVFACSVMFYFDVFGSVKILF